MDRFEQIEADKLATTMQYDYFRAYLAFYQEDVETAGEIAERYVNHEVPRWNNAFANVRSQVKEIRGGGVEVVDDQDRTQAQTQLASSDPTFEFDVESKQVHLRYQNISEVQVNYYLMDIELLFSRNPFVQEFSGQFSYIRPNLQQTVKLSADKKQHQFALPASLLNRNVLVEISSGGQTKLASASKATGASQPLMKTPCSSVVCAPRTAAQ